MKIELKKFGTTLTSRQLGKEALAAFQPILKDVGKNEIVEVNFEGVNTFSPSWGAEFLIPLNKKYPGRLVLKRSENLSVKITLELLEKVSGEKFDVR